MKINSIPFSSVMLFAILIVAFLLRLYRLDGPIADWHSWRQADTAAVARNFIKFGFDPLLPRYDDVSNIQSGKDNPNGWRMVEFPLYQALGFAGYNLFPIVSIEAWLRLITIAASLGTTFILFKLVERTTDTVTGHLASFIFSVLPYSIYYGRSILPDTLSVFLSLLAIYLLILAYDTTGRAERRVTYIILAAFAGAASVLAKPVGIFLLIGAFYLQGKQIRLKVWHAAEVIIFWGIVFVPIVLWRLWILRFPEGIPVYGWLFNAGGIRLKGAWFYWLFAERLAKLILGYWGVFLFALGLLVYNVMREGFLYLWLLAGALIYFLVLAGGNVQHDYYQILIIPIVSIFVAKGISYLVTNSSYPRLTRYSLAIVSFLFMIAFSWYSVRTYYWINRGDIVEAGRVADALLPKNAKVIAPYNGDTSFLYQINRQGWPLGFDIDKKMAQGATHYVTVSPRDDDLETRDLSSEYEVLIRNDRYAIIKLQ